MLFAVVIAIRGAGNRFELVGDCIAAPRRSLLHPSFLADWYLQPYLKLLITVHAL
jgi:hypothetical protein